MRVYGGNFFLNGKQVRGIMAGTQKQVAQKIKSSVSYVREFWAQTGNETELKTARGEPGTLFWCDINKYTNRVYEKVNA